MMFNTGDLILDAVILSIVARTPEGTYGYKITQDVRSKMDVPESTFYPLLKQMEIDGYLEVYHKDIGGRSRRFYKITESGMERLAFCQQNWTNYLQNASALLMGAPVTNTTVPQENTAQPAASFSSDVQTQTTQTVSAETEPQMAQTETELMNSAPADDYSIASSDITQNDNSFEFSLGEEEPASENSTAVENESDLFEFDTTVSIPEVASIAVDDIPQSAMQESSVYTEQPVMQETPEFAEEPVIQKTDELTEEPVTREAQEYTESSVSKETQEFSDDEADFLAEMELGEAEEITETDVKASGKSDNETELESLLSQLRSFESRMTAHKEYKARTNAETDSNVSIDITNLQAVAALLNAAPAINPETVATVPTEPEVSSAAPAETPVQQPASANTETVSSAPVAETEEPAVRATEPARTEVSDDTVAKVRYKEVRNPETDESVNSLVDLLKDEPVKKTGFLKRMTKATSKLKADASIPVERVVPDDKTSSPAAKGMADGAKPDEVMPEKEVPKTAIRYEEVRNPETDESVNSLVDLLKNDEPVQKARFFKPKAKKSIEPEIERISAEEFKKTLQAAEKPVKEAPVIEASYKPKYTEVRNPETDESVNSLVDLLKNDEASSKPRLFRSRSSRTSVNEAAEAMKISSIPKAAPVPPVSEKAEPVQAVAPKPEPAVASKPVPEEVRFLELNSSESNDSVDNLADLLMETDTVAKPRIFRPKAKQGNVTTTVKTTPEPIAADAIQKPAAKQVESAKQPVSDSLPKKEHIRSVESDDSVDALVGLLTGNSSSQNKSSIFGKAKTYNTARSAIPKVTKPEPKTVSAPVSDPAAAQQSSSTVASASSAEPKQLIKPEMNTKSFEAKAASANARPVETRATITKPLEAKAISTKPDAAKAVEAKSVETKAVVTPKEDTKPAAAPASEEEEAIDVNSFKYRLMKAHLLPDQD